MSEPTLPYALPLGYALASYRITRVIGAGGFGITYEAQNRVTKHRRAIKEFYPLGLANRDSSSQVIYSQSQNSIIAWALEKFETTTERLCELDHPNVLRVHDYMEANGTGYMIMEYLEGETFEGWLKAMEPHRPDSAMLKPILDPVLDALAYVHGKGLIHRDVAPDNIIIGSDGRPVLIDFGAISQDVSKATRAVGTMGIAKLNYTAPEQARQDARPDQLADIYSVGAVLYRALAGQPPADGGHRMSEVALAGADAYRPLSNRSTIDARVAKTVDACLALRKAERPSSIVAVRERLGWLALEQVARDDEGDEAELLAAINAPPPTRPAPDPPKVVSNSAVERAGAPFDPEPPRARRSVIWPMTGILAGIVVTAGIGALVYGYGIAPGSNRPFGAPTIKTPEARQPAPQPIPTDLPVAAAAPAGKTDDVITSFGLTLLPLNDALRRRYKIKPDVQGLIVTNIDPGSMAARSGIAQGEVIVEIGLVPVHAPSDFEKRAQELKLNRKQTALLFVKDANGNARFVSINL